MSKFKVGDKVKTRDGQDVEIFYTNDVLERPVFGAITKPDGAITVSFWSADGSRSDSGLICNMDILPLPRTVTLYRAIIHTTDGYYFTPTGLFQGLEDDELKKWDTGSCSVVRLLTEYPIEVIE